MPKLAPTACAWDMVTWQGPLPEQAPEKPTKTESAAATADRVTTVPAGYGYEQVAFCPGIIEQAALGGSTSTVPKPFSVPETETVSDCGPRKVAVTFIASDMVTVQGPVPVQAPPKPTNTLS